MLDRRYAGVLADWDGKQSPALQQILAARSQIGGRVVDVNRASEGSEQV